MDKPIVSEEIRLKGKLPSTGFLFKGGLKSLKTVSQIVARKC